jgi:hypothetical protein
VNSIFKKKAVFEVDASDLNVFVSLHTNRAYDVVATLEGSNDTEHKVYVNSHALDGYDQNNLDVWRTGEGVDPHPRVVLTWLCSKGVIEPGEYLISVCW